ncbi:flagellar basal body rod C-terminal domain-containing protein [Photobacterium leiognathi]|uniref:flagellar basal body rod C-terminal domain-containing protein n=1 Tax=Photobacterium leiognathi TaxID=553611 RepID=UPI0029821ED4|nr:flagellar basal body rod C-terminal domain-containing protein [Photobacterium leiognathi]
MENLSPVQLMSLSIGIEQKELEAVTKNLSLIGQSFDKKLSVETPKEVNVENFPTVYNIINGKSVNEVVFDIDDNPSKVKKSLVFEGDKTKFEYSADIKIEEEMIRLGEATKAYEASIRLFNISKEMSSKAIQIGSKR